MKFFIGLVFIVMNSLAFAQTGYVNMNEAIGKTKQGQQVKRRLEKDLKKAKKSIESIEKQLKKERASLDRELPLLSEQQKAQRVQKFQQKVLGSQQQVEVKRNQLKKLEEKLMNPIVNKLEKVIGDVAKKEGYTVVKNKNQDVLWVSSKNDLTKKVYTLYNKKYR